MYPPLNTACISRSSACHVFWAIHHNRSCHSWLESLCNAIAHFALCTVQAARALPTVPTVQAAHCALCTVQAANCALPTVQLAHCATCPLCEQPRNKYLGTIQLPHHQLNWGVPFIQNCAIRSKLHESAAHPTPAIFYVHHPSPQVLYQSSGDRDPQFT